MEQLRREHEPAQAGALRRRRLRDRSVRAGRPLVVVTGASGLIGTRVVNDLARDHRVVGLDKADPGEAFTGEEFIACDLTDDDSVDRALERLRERHGDHVASVVHLAAYYDFAGEPSPLYEELTVKGTERLLERLQSFHVDQFVFTSSLLVLKTAEEGELLTEESPTEADWDYPRSKLEAEAAIERERGSIPAVILRIAGAYDERGHSPPLTQQLARIHEKKLESVVFPGQKSHGQAFVHLSDVVRCVRKVIGARERLAPQEIFLIAEPRTLSYEGLQREMGELMHGRAWPTLRIPAPVAKAGAWAKNRLARARDREEFIKPWMVDLADDHRPVSIARARERLGWEPTHSLATTLPRMVRSLRRDPIGFYEENELPLTADMAEEKEKAEARRRESERRGQPESDVLLREVREPDLDVSAPPWRYNPSAWSQRIPIAVLATIGALIAAYLALYQWRLIEAPWDPLFGDGTRLVLDSQTSESMRRWMGMPDATLGVLAYLGDAIYGLAGSTRRWQYRPWIVVLFGIDVIPLGIVSAVLVFLQATVVGHYCFLCIVTAVISLVLVRLAADEVWSTLRFLQRVWKKSRSIGLVWRTFWGRPSAIAEEVALMRNAEVR